MSEEAESPDTDEAPEAPVLRAAGGDFRGIKLKPATAMVQAIAQGMGMKWPFIGKDGFEQYEATGVYAGALMDTVIFTWLRTLDREALQRAAYAPRNALEDAMAWMGKNRIASGSPAFKEAFTLFRKTMVDIANATAEPDVPRGTKKKSPARKAG